jgi:hypothetical protein
MEEDDMKKVYGVVMAAFVVFSCGNTEEGQSPVTEVAAVTESGGIMAGFEYGDIAITGGGGTIYKTGTPGSLTLSAEGYEDCAWYIDGSETALTGNPVTVNAADYTANTHTASFVGNRGGQQYSKSVTFRVADEAGPTPAIEFANLGDVYQSDIAFDSGEGAWTGQGTATEGWTLNVTEEPAVYFAVYKTAAQAIAAGGTDGARVSIAESGTFDGITATSEMAVVRVDARDLVFDGGEREFTLNVSEDGALPRAVRITLNVNTSYETGAGAAVFKLAGKDAEGVETLRRVGDDVNTPNVNEGAFDGLASAFTWVEENAEANAEYTLRIEKDEPAMPLLVVSLNNAENVTLRFKGSQEGPWTLRPVHFEGNGQGAVPAVNVKNVQNPSAIITIGGAQSGAGIFPKKTFILGSNVTIQSHTINTAQAYNYRIGFDVGRNTTLVLEPGSKITGYNYTAQGGYLILVRVTSEPTLDVKNHGKLRIEGGSITNCAVYEDKGLIRFGLGLDTFTDGAFYLAGGNALALEGNSTQNDSNAGDIVFGNNGTPRYALDVVNGMSIPPAPPEGN